MRRTPAAQAVPALLQAVAEHGDGYVRYRALVLLTGFNDPRTKDAMRESMASPNDRLRTVAYSFLRAQSRPGDGAGADWRAREGTGRVRPSGAGPRARGARRRILGCSRSSIRDVARGEDFFRGAVIEALGDYKAQYAIDAITTIAKLDGPLQDDSAIALGRIGDKRSLETLAGLQRTAPRPRQPAIAAAICLLGVNCDSHEPYLIETLKFGDKNPGFQELLRGAAAGLGALAISGRPSAATALLDVGIPSRDPTRAPVALALAAVALRNTPLMLQILEPRSDRPAAIGLVAEGFDMLEEDLDKERFFAFVRRILLGVRRRVGDQGAHAVADRKSGFLMDYRQSGVDIDAGNETVRRIKSLARATFTPGVLSEIGSFGGLFALDPARLPGTGPGLERRRRRHQAQGRLHARQARHDWRGPGQPLRERHPRAGRHAALLPRLPRDRPPLARCGRAGRDRRRARLPRKRLCAHRR